MYGFLRPCSIEIADSRFRIWPSAQPELMPSVMGVDPGVRGGIAVIEGPVAPTVHTWAFKPEMAERELITMIREAVETCPSSPICYMERVGYMPGDGGLGAFTFGKVYGLLRGSLLALDVDVRDVAPAVWQSKLECLSGGNKNVTKKRAQELFPQIKVTHSIADALLIATYGRRMLDGAQG